MGSTVGHDAHVEVGMEGAKVTCTCGEWSSHPGSVGTATEKRKDAMERWYQHFLSTTKRAEATR
jgi:hypothetical protein